MKFLLFATAFLCASIFLCKAGLSERYKSSEENDEDLSISTPSRNARKYSGDTRTRNQMPVTRQSHKYDDDTYHQKKLANLRKMIQQGFDDWVEFKAKYGKVYKSVEEESTRFFTFLVNLKKVRKHNMDYKHGKETFKMGINHLSDMSPQEYKKLNGLRIDTNRIKGTRFLEPHYVDLPDQVDWRDKGYVTGVKDQGDCGSCWAFSATGSLEGQHMRSTGKLVSLSEQNLVDCSQSFNNSGCDGGWMDYAFQYIKSNGGIDTEISYPYKAEDDPCQFKKSGIGADDTGYVDLPSGDEDKLKVAVATQGPISVGIDASGDKFQMYKEGVFYDATCSSTDLDHGVLVVGYGTDPEGGDYWLVKNSWSEKWGDKGYIKMARNKNNNCGIASAASYPLV